MSFTKASDSTFGIAKLVGEGFGRPDAKDESPLDIQYSKLAEWLGTRKHLPVDWRKRLRAIQAAVTTELKSLPPQLSIDEAVDYFAAQVIRNSLAEDADKGLFGGLKGSAGTWDKLVKAYEKQNIHLAEAGNTLIRNVDFEIPYFKKQAEKLQHQIGDHSQKHEDYLRSADIASRHFKQECEGLGIQGSNIGQELTQLQHQLPGLYAEALSTVQNPAISAAVAHYASFTAYAHGAAGSDSAAASTAQMLPSLSKIQELHSRASDATDTQSSLLVDDHSAEALDAAPDQAQEAADIDWDIVDESPAAAPAATSAADDITDIDIDWDVDVQPSEAANEQASDTGAQGTDTQQTDINWDIDMAETAEQQDAAQPQLDAAVAKRGIGSSAVGNEAAVHPCPASAVQLSQDSSSRALLLDDLYELHSFLLQQAQEMSSGNHDSLATSMLNVEQRTSLATIQQQQKVVKQLLDKLTDSKVQQLVMIKTSKQYLSRLERALRQKGGQHDKFRRLAQELSRKQEEQERALKSNAGKLQALLQQTRRVKAFVEATVSALCDNRKINIIGEINKVI